MSLTLSLLLSRSPIASLVRSKFECVLFDAHFYVMLMCSSVDECGLLHELTRLCFCLGFFPVYFHIFWMLFAIWCICCCCCFFPFTWICHFLVPVSTFSCHSFGACIIFGFVSGTNSNNLHTNIIWFQHLRIPNTINWIHRCHTKAEKLLSILFRSVCSVCIEFFRWAKKTKR